MAAKPSRADSASSGTSEIDALNKIRLEKNWTYKQLADDMARAGFGLASKTLQSLINYRPTPYDRTLYQIQRYLEVVRDRDKSESRKAASAR